MTACALGWLLHQRGARQRLTERTEGDLTIVGLLILCVIAGAALYLLNLVPIDATVKTVIRVIVIVILVVYVILFLAALAGLSTGLPGLRPR